MKKITCILKRKGEANQASPQKQELSNPNTLCISKRGRTVNDFHNFFLKKHQNLIFSSGKISSLGIRLINSMLYNASFTEKNEHGEYSIRTGYLKKLAGTISSTDFLKRKLDMILNTKYIFNFRHLADRSGKVSQEIRGSFLKSFRTDMAGSFCYTLNDQVEKILRQPEFYTTITSEITNKFRRLRTVALYELIMASHIARNGAGQTKNISVQDLKDLIGMGKNKYSNYDFQKYVLKPALAEINEKAQINARYETVRDGRCIMSFKFLSDAKIPVKCAQKPDKKKESVVEKRLEVKTKAPPDDDMSKYPKKCRAIVRRILKEDGQAVLDRVIEYTNAHEPKNKGAYMRTVWENKLYKNASSYSHSVGVTDINRNDTDMLAEKQAELEAYKDEETHYLNMPIDELEGLANEKKKIGTRFINANIVASKIYNMRMAEATV